MNDANQLTLDMLIPEQFQTSTFSLSDGLAKIILLLESEVDKEKAHEVAYCLRQLEYFGISSPVILSLKTSRDYFLSITEETSTQQFESLPKWGMTFNGNYLIQGGFSPKIENESTLLDILEEQAGPEYFLSMKSIRFLGNYATKRGRYLLAYEQNLGGLISKKFTSSNQIEEYAEQQSWSVSAYKDIQMNGTTNAKKLA